MLTGAFLVAAVAFQYRGKKHAEQALVARAEGETSRLESFDAERKFLREREASVRRELAVTQVARAAEAFESGDHALAQRCLASVPEERRGFVHGLLTRTLEDSVRFFGRHEDDISALSHWVRTTLLASGSRDGSVLVWTIADREPIASFEEADEITAVAISPFGDWLACATIDGTVSAWNIDNGDYIEGTDVESCRALALTRDEVILGTEDGRVLAWKPEQGSELRELGRHDDTVNEVRVHENLIVSVSDDGTARCFGRKDDVFEISDRWITSCAIDPDGSHVLVGTDSGTVQFFSLGEATTTPSRTIHDSSTAILAVDFGVYPNESSTFSASGERRRRWHPNDRGDWQTLPGLERRVQLASLHWSGVVFTTGDSELHFWMPDTPLRRRVVLTTDDRVRTISSSNNGDHVVCSTERDLILWDREHSSTRTLGRPVRCATITGEGARVGISSLEDQVLEWDSTENEPRELLETESGDPVIAISPTADGGWLLSTRGGRMMRLDHTGHPRDNRPGPRGALPSIATSPNGDLYGWTANGGTIRIWNTLDGSRAFALRDRRLGLTDSLAISANGSRAVVVHDGVAVTYDLSRGSDDRHVVRVFDEYSGVRLAALDPTGDLVACALFDGRVVLFDAHLGTELITLTDPNELSVSAITFSGDGRSLFVGTADGRVLEWEGSR